MTGPIAFDPVPAPAPEDTADGVKAFNGIAAADEANFNKVNGWAAQATDKLAYRASITGSALFTPASGWSATASQQANTYGRKWLGITYLRLDFTRIGANLVCGSRGNITDTVIGTVAAGWRPTINDLVFSGSLYNCTPVTMMLRVGGELRVIAFSYPYQEWTSGWYGIAQLAFTGYGV